MKRKSYKMKNQANIFNTYMVHKEVRIVEKDDKNLG